MYNSVEISNRIKSIAKFRNTSVRQMLVDIGLGQNTMSNMKTSMPKSENLAKIADYLDCSVDYLLGRTDDIHGHTEEPPARAPKLKGVKIPVLGRVQAGLPVEATQEILDYEEITEQMAATGDFFGLCVRGESMSPYLLPDDIVIVRQQPDADSGDIVIASIGLDDATVKKLKKTPTGIALIPLNERFPTLYYTFQQIEELPVRIVGKVVELRRKV